MQQITAKQLKQQLAHNPSILLIDVREEDEHAAFNIGGTLIPLNEIIGKADQIPKDQPVVVYCKRGLRSQIAIQRLQEKFGFSNLINLQGGLEKWK